MDGELRERVILKVFSESRVSYNIDLQFGITIMSINAEVNKFKNWANDYPERERSGEWECDYNDWDALYKSVLDFLLSSQDCEWTDSEINDLLYALARDNEMEYLAKELARDTNRLLKLAFYAIQSSESDAKWQLAVQLGVAGCPKEDAESLLLHFVEDENEYVKRRTLLSLGILKSSKAESLAERAWATGHEYQRIAALWVLKYIASSKLPEYLQRAKKDGRKYVIQNALEIQNS